VGSAGLGAGDPWTVAAEFGTDATWLVSRELLSAGLYGGVGDGDVQLVPMTDGTRTALRLESPDGVAVIALDTGELAEFLDGTYREIPEGQELLWAPIDEELTALMNGSDR
jgi:hypothetical protein